jgi:hypothetical protein
MATKTTKRHEKELEEQGPVASRKAASSPSSSFRGFSCFLWPFLFCGLALAILAATAAADNQPLPDPLPLRRVILPPARLAEALRQANNGVLRQMPRREFDALVRDAARAVKLRKDPPRLVEARYRATLTEGLALMGTAEWKLLYRGDRPALLRLQEEGRPFNLAVSRPRYDNRDALLAEFPDPATPTRQSLALLVDQPGQHTVTLDWSARAEARPEGLQIDLRLPACPAALLELNLPADRTAATLDGTLVSGPHPAESADRRVWRIAAGGRSHVPLLIRRGGPGRGTAVLLARQKTVQKLTTDGLESSTTLTVEVLHQDVRELTLLVDPILRPIDVSSPHLDRWDVLPGGKVLVRFERGLREVTLKVQCLAPLSPAAEDDRPGGPGRPAPFLHWISPGLRLDGAICRGENLEIHLHPELRMGSWDPGDYRLVEASSLVDPQSKVAFRRLVLEGGNLARSPPGKPAAPTRPSAQIQAGGVEYRTRQLTFWRLGPERTDLTVQLDYHVRHGLLFQLPVRLPAGWEIDSVDLAAPHRLRSWGVRLDRSGALLLVDLLRPLRPAPRVAGAGVIGSPAESPFRGVADSAPATPPGSVGGRLLIRLRPVQPGPLTGRDLPFPDPVPVGAWLREGGLALGFDARVYRARLSSTSPSGEAPTDGPWEQTSPDYFYPYSGEPLSGSIRLESRPPRFRARAFSDVFVSAGRAGLESRILLEGESGHPTAVDIYLAPGAGPRGWDWRVMRGPGQAGRPVRVEPLGQLQIAAGLLGLSSGHPLAAVLTHAARPAGTWWRLHLDRPLPPGQSLTLKVTHPLTASGEPGRPFWRIPLPVVLGTPPGETGAEVTLHLDGADQVALVSQGLRAALASSTSLSRATAWRSFRYGDISARLTVWARVGERGATPGSATLIDQARLTTTLTTEGTLRHHFRFRLVRWPQRTVPVRLPPGARLLAAAVDGHWLSRVEARDGEPLELPVPVTADGAPRFEVLYTSAAARGLFWSRLSAPAPDLPEPPVVFERRWLLPPGCAPLSESSELLLPGEDLARPFLSPPRRLAGLLAWPLPQLLRLMPASTPDRQQALTDALAAFNARHAGKKLPLAQAIEDLAFGYLKETHPLLIDRLALGRAGARHSLPLTIPPSEGAGRPDPFEAAGLVLVPARPGVLLTSQAQEQRWRGQTGDGPDWPASIEAAVSEATRQGRDSSGRFLTALSWLSEETDSVPPALLPGTAALEGWTAWQPIVEGDADHTVIVVGQRQVLVVGLVAAFGLTVGLAIVIVKALRGRLAYLLTWLAVAGLLLAWLPAALAELAWWPLLAGLASSGVCFLAWAASPRRPALPAAPSGTSKKVVAGAGAAVVLLALSASGQNSSVNGQATEPDLVVIVPAATATQQTVLVAPALVTRLRELTRGSLAPTQGIVLASALYEGKLASAQHAEFSATLYAHVLGDDPALLELPLDGVQLLGDVLVDGARAFPVALAAPKTGYALKIRGKGRHKIELRFQTAVSMGAGDGPDNAGVRQVRFSVPRVVQSRLVFRPGVGASHLQATVKHGSQVLASEPGGPRLDVDLGALTSPVQLRWYQEPKQPRPVQVQFREAYVWNLAPDASTLTACVRFRISGGATSTLQVALPAELDVRAAQARRPAGSGPADTSVRLTDWTVTAGPGNRILHLAMPGPVSGEVEVMLELVPRTPWAGTVHLPLPRPVGQPAEPVSYLGYRAEGLDAFRGKEFRGLSGIERKKFAPFWPATSRPTTLDYAGTFRAEPRQAPQAELILIPRRPRIQAQQNITFRVGRRQAELSARVELSALSGDLMLAEFFLPGRVVLTDVSGPDVQRWAQHDNRLVVWLASRTPGTSIDLTGWVPLNLPAPGKKAKSPPARLDLPCLRPAHVQTVETRLTLACEPGLTLVPQGKMWNLARLGPAQARLLVYSSKAPSHGATFAVLPSGPAPHAAIRTELARRDRDLVFTTTIDYRPDGEPRPIEVRLRQWPGDAQLEAPDKGVTRRREVYRHQAGRHERRWTLDVSAGAARPVRLVVRGRLSLDEALDGVLAPEIVIPGARGTQEVVVDDSLVADSSSGLRSLPAPAAGRQAWAATGVSWSLRLLPRDQSRSAQVRVLLAEHHARLVAGPTSRPADEAPSRWLHEVSWWLWQDGPSALRVTWPAGVDLVSAAVDGQSMPLQRSLSGTMFVPLSGPAGARHLRIQFRYPEGHEELDRPDLTGPRLDPAEAGPIVWTVEVPPGWHLAAGSRRPLRDPSRQAVVELYRARAQLALGRLLVEHGHAEPALAQARGRLRQSLRLAGLALDAGAAGTGPEDQSLAAWRSRLRSAGQDLLDSGPSAESVPAQAASGAAMSWMAESTGAAPPVRLEPALAGQVQAALSFSLWWLAAVVLVAVAARSAMLRAMAQWLWPETLVLAGIAAGQFAGLTLPVLLLVLAGVIGRVVLVLLAVSRMMARPPHQAPGSTALRG